MPRAGIEPAQPRGPRDFKSLASTYSATQAVCCYCFFFIGSLFCATRLGSNIPGPSAIGYVTAYITKRTVLFAGRTLIRRDISPEGISAI